MNVAQQKQQKGFTIIEVILVLAIAGLIFLMVFLALPALQRGQRDTQRKNDVSRAITALQNYQSNARGALPANAAAWTTFETQYLKSNGDSFQDPSTNADYAFVAGAISGSATFNSEKGNIHYTVGSTCAGDGSTLNNGAGSGKVAFQLKLEGGGFDCANN